MRHRQARDSGWRAHRQARRPPGQDFLQGPLKGGFTEHEITRLVVAMAQQAKHDVVGAPDQRIVRRIDGSRNTTREGAAGKALRTLVVEKPWQARKQAARKVAVEQGRSRAGRLEKEFVAIQRVKFAEPPGFAVGIDSIQRPTAAGTRDVVGKRITRRAGATDADDARARVRQEARQGRLADIQFVRQDRGRLGAACTQQGFETGETIAHAAD
jgi:hypothetical protein